jgi:hypothetical protein
MDGVRTALPSAVTHSSATKTANDSATIAMPSDPAATSAPARRTARAPPMRSARPPNASDPSVATIQNPVIATPMSRSVSPRSRWIPSASAEVKNSGSAHAAIVVMARAIGRTSAGMTAGGTSKIRGS